MRQPTYEDNRRRERHGRNIILGVIAAGVAFCLPLGGYAVGVAQASSEQGVNITGDNWSALARASVNLSQAGLCTKVTPLTRPDRVAEGEMPIYHLSGSSCPRGTRRLPNAETDPNAKPLGWIWSTLEEARSESGRYGFRTCVKSVPDGFKIYRC